MNNIIDGKALAKIKEQQLKEKIAGLDIKPKVVSVLVGEDPSSLQYSKMKQKKAQQLGINFEIKKFAQDENFSEVAQFIISACHSKKTTGVMVQLPLPNEFLADKQPKQLLNLIRPKMDIDGLSEKSKILPAAVRAVLAILEMEEMGIKGKYIVILGAGNLVGKPLAKKLIELGAIVEVCDINTINLIHKTLMAQIIICATGTAGLLTGEMVSEGVIIIDVGTSELNGKIVGDVDFLTVAPKAYKITPVPGGVGPMTIISLMENIIEAAIPPQL